jgi:hypothetical protein
MTRYLDCAPQQFTDHTAKGPAASRVKILNGGYEGYFTSAPSGTREGAHHRHLRRRRRIPSGHPTDPLDVRKMGAPVLKVPAVIRLEAPHEKWRPLD